MEWMLWICITAQAAGACVTEKFWRVPAGRADCLEQVRLLRVEPAPAPITIGEATAVDVAGAPAGRVVAACIQAPAATATKPAAPAVAK